MATATYNGTVIAESDDVVEVEGNAYFPRASVKDEYLKESDVTTHCPWKGDAKYFDVSVDGDTAEYAAWYYPSPKDAAKEIEGRLAFWRGVEISGV